MKQTIAILTALLFSVMILSFFILTGSIRQTDMLAQRDEMIVSLREDQRTLTQESLRLSRELERVTKERDALSLQLNSAVLASQEANDAVALQIQQREVLEEALAAVTLELEGLRKQIPLTN